MNHNLKEIMLNELYEYSLPDVAEKLFMHINTARRIEKQAIMNFKIEMSKRGYTVTDLI